MTNRAQEVINFLRTKFGTIQTFNTRNIANDVMKTIYENDGVIIDYCYDWEYVEIFGLTEEEFFEVQCSIG